MEIGALGWQLRYTLQLGLLLSLDTRDEDTFHKAGSHASAFRVHRQRGIGLLLAQGHSYFSDQGIDCPIWHVTLSAAMSSRNLRDHCPTAYLSTPASMNATYGPLTHRFNAATVGSMMCFCPATGFCLLPPLLVFACYTWSSSAKKELPSTWLGHHHWGARYADNSIGSNSAYLPNNKRPSSLAHMGPRWEWRLHSQEEWVVRPTWEDKEAAYWAWGKEGATGLAAASA